MAGKPALVGRRWVQLLATAVVAFGLGASVDDTEAEGDPTRAARLAQVAEQRLDEATSENDELADQLARAQDDAAAEVARVTEAAAIAQEQAVADAEAAVRAAADARQQDAVAAAVADAEARSARDTAAPSVDEAPTSGGGGGTDPRFDTCGAANDAGYGDYVDGVDPEYDWYDDRDGDGSVCES